MDSKRETLGNSFGWLPTYCMFSFGDSSTRSEIDSWVFRSLSPSFAWLLVCEAGFCVRLIEDTRCESSIRYCCPTHTFELDSAQVNFSQWHTLSKIQEYARQMHKQRSKEWNLKDHHQSSSSKPSSPSPSSFPTISFLPYSPRPSPPPPPPVSPSFFPPSFPPPSLPNFPFSLLGTLALAPACLFFHMPPYLYPCLPSAKSPSITPPLTRCQQEPGQTKCQAPGLS